MKPSSHWNHESVLSLEKHVQAYALKEGLWRGTNRKNTDWPSAFGDVLADFMHLADKHSVDWEEVVRRADNHHSAERMMECQKCGLLMDESESECPDCACEEIEIDS